MEDLLRIAKEAEKLLDTVMAVFQENQVDLPERRFLAIGETAHDCEQVSVSFTSAGVGNPGDAFPARQNCSATAYNATFNVEIVRKTPQGVTSAGGSKFTPPPVSSMQDYGVPRMTDAWLLIKSAQRYAQLSYASQSATYSITVSNDSGGMQAVILSYSGNV